MASFQSLMIPAYEFQFNLLVCPLPRDAARNVSFESLINHLNWILHRVRARFLFLRTMTPCLPQLGVSIGWVSFQTICTASFHLLMLSRDQLRFWTTSLTGLMISSFLLKLERYVEMTNNLSFYFYSRLNSKAASLRLKSHLDFNMRPGYKRQIINLEKFWNICRFWISVIS